VTSVTFSIRRDGSVTDLAFESRSGNASFDFEAMGAVECAGQGRFGPLPEELPYEVQPIRFEFRPSGGE
jgi:outer membrane biosynthesis protein TonB